MLGDAPDVQRRAEPAAVGPDTYEVDAVLMRLGDEGGGGVAGHDPADGVDPALAGAGRGALERRLGLGPDVGVVGSVGLHHVDEFERGPERRGDPRALPSRLLRSRGSVRTDEHARQAAPLFGQPASLNGRPWASGRSTT